MTPLGNNNLNFRLAHDQVVHFWNRGKFVCQPRQEKIFFHAVMAAKRFQTRTEQEIEQLLRDKSSKSTNKATDSAVRTLRNFCKEQNLDKCFHELSKTDLNSLLRKFCNNFVSWYLFYFELGGITKHLMTGPWGNSEICFPSTLNVPLSFASETLGSRGNKTHCSLGASH